MTISLKQLDGRKVQAVDGVQGRIRDALLDDETWALRFLVSSRGPWRFGSRILIPRDALAPQLHPDRVALTWTRQRLHRADPASSVTTVSQHYEQRLHAQSTLEPPWASTLPDVALEAALLSGVPEESHLRSARELIGYHVQAADRELGPVVDLIADHEDWTVRLVAVRLGGRIRGRRVYVPTRWVDQIHWLGRVVQLTQPLARIEQLGVPLRDAREVGTW